MYNPLTLARSRRLAADAVYVIVTLGVALTLTWVVLAKLNFSYGIWHDVGGIGEAIDKYGAQNRFKKGFHLTSKLEREALFKQINVAIHANGEGLGSITYTVAQLPEQTLLRDPEIVHLQDVANLINVGKVAALIVLVGWVAFVVMFVRGILAMPSLKQQGIVLGVLVCSIILVVLAYGAKEVFYLLHEWVFPDNHQWFFYYQESLMSTMMYAPYLFGYVAVQWGIMALLFYAAMHLGLQSLLKSKFLGRSNWIEKVG